MPRPAFGLLLLLGCAPSNPSGNAESDTPGGSEQAKTREEPLRETRELRKQDLGQPVSIDAEGRFALTLGTPRGVAPEYRFTLGDPTVTGDGARFVERETVPPPRDVDGGSTKHRFVFEAAETGTATITIPKSGGSEVDGESFVLEIVVR